MNLSFTSPDLPSALLQGHYDPVLVLLSVALAALAGVAAMVVSAQASRFRGPQALGMVLAGGLALGSGVWAMHFVGMLALDLCHDAAYRLDLTLLSMVPSVLASSLALWVLMLRQQDTRTLWLGGGLFGAGVGAMHYSGMLALEGAQGLTFDARWVAVSVAVAVVLAVFALWVRQALKQWLPSLDAGWRNIVAGVLMGFSVSAMHYTGMAAVHFTNTPAPAADGAGADWLVTGLAVTVSAISVMVVLMSMVLRLRDLTAWLRHVQSVVEGSGDAIITKTLDGVVTSWNQGATNIFGYTAAEMIGQPVTRLFRPQDLASEQEILQQIRVGRAVPNSEVVRLRRDGSEVYLSLSISPIRDEAGNVVAASKIAQDISDRKALIDLEVAKLQAEKVAAARGQFLANMSHELRTPLNAILGFVGMVQQGPLLADQRQQLKLVEASAGALLGLFNDILETTKLDRGLLSLDIRPFRLDELLHQLNGLYAAAALDKGLDLSMVAHPDAGPVWEGDAFRIRQLLGQLLDNAIKFTSHGRVTLDIRAAQDGLTFIVADTGCGMPDAFLEHLFEPFSQLDASTTRRFDGSGLGTTLCRQLVDLMDGSIEVNSRLGEGSTFRVWLPMPDANRRVESAAAARNDKAAAPGPVPVLSTGLPPLKVLIADDVLFNMEVLRRRLESTHQVTCVNGGAEAVQAVAGERFDVVLMDVCMPGVDGLEATRRIRARERDTGTPAVPIVALTAGSEGADVEAARASGMDGFVSRSAKLPALLAEIARVLARAGPTPNAAGA